MTSKTKVLAVDDDEFNLDIMTGYLEEEGFEVITAANGDRALHSLETIADIELIILDRMMPDMSGIEVLEKIKNIPRLKNIPVIMQTAAAGADKALQGMEAGACAYLTKPYEDTALISIVKAALKNSGYRPS
jgi:CheY-like chemotaxis protein